MYSHMLWKSLFRLDSDVMCAASGSPDTSSKRARRDQQGESSTTGRIYLINVPLESRVPSDSTNPS